MEKSYTIGVLEKYCGFGGYAWAAVPGSDRFGDLEKEARRLGAAVAVSGFTGVYYAKTITAGSVAAVKRAGAEYLKQFINDIHDAAAAARA